MLQIYYVMSYCRLFMRYVSCKGQTQAAFLRPPYFGTIYNNKKATSSDVIEINQIT